MAAFTNGIFLAPNAMWFNPQAGHGKDTRLVDVLESASRRMSGELKDDPLAELTLRTTLARTLMFLGMYQRATEEAERASQLLPAVSGQAPEVEAELAVCRCDIPWSQMKYREAEPWCRQAVTLVRRVGGSPNRLMIPAAGHLGVLLAASGNRREAESLFREGLAAIPNPTGSDRNGVLNLRGNFAGAKTSWGEFREAAEDYRRILADSVGITDTNGESAMLHANLASCYRALGDLASAEAELRMAMQIASTHPIGNEARSWRTPVSLAMTLAMEGKLAEAESVLRGIAPRIESNTTLEGFFEIAWGVCALNRGDAAGSERRFRRAAEVYQRTLPPGDATLAQVSRRLASALQAQGRLAEARAAVEEAIRIYAIRYGSRNPILAEARTYLQKLSQ
jgi:tetratricopeptide (TPR) repeat protein